MEVPQHFGLGPIFVKRRVAEERCGSGEGCWDSGFDSRCILGTQCVDHVVQVGFRKTFVEGNDDFVVPVCSQVDSEGAGFGKDALSLWADIHAKGVEKSGVQD